MGLETKSTMRSCRRASPVENQALVSMIHWLGGRMRDWLPKYNVSEAVRC
jgi:hypothetical protein